MINYIRVENFKSLGDVTLELNKFNCLIGLNGAGKSSILQALDFISQLMFGDIESWLEVRGWTASELGNKFRKENNIKIVVGIITEQQSLLVWHASFNRHDLKCSSEAFACVADGLDKSDIEDLAIPLPEDFIFRVSGQSYRLRGQPKKDIPFTYQGSILSQLRESELPPQILELRDAVRGIRSLELLSPHLMRKRARKDELDIGSGGEKLSGYLAKLKGERRTTLLSLLSNFYPNLVDFKISNLRAGWKKLIVVEQYGERKLETEATHLNDGLLRILAILAQTSSDKSLILLDEVENGINQELIEKLVNLLLECRQQIIVTTHSPLVLNYLDDERAKQAVKFVYKSPSGETKLKPFFSIPRITEKLSMMGAGDAFVDTNLIELAKECNQMDLQGLARKQELSNG